MDMTNDNDQLLQQFFSEAARQEIADNGFSRRVMSRLPSRINWFTRIWTACCVLIAVVLFYVSNGWELLLASLEVLVRTALVHDFQIHPLMLIASALVLMWIGIIELFRNERRLAL